MAASGSHIVVGVVPGHVAEVVSTAAVFARKFRAELVCANVDASRYTAAFAPDGTAVSLPLTPDHSEGRRERFNPELRDEIAAELAGTGVEWRVEALAGRPARELELLANRVGALMIIVGTRDPGTRETLRELFNGSVADKLVRKQRRPIVIVPANPVGINDDHPESDPTTTRRS